MKTGTLLLLAGAGLALYYGVNLGIAANTVQIVFQGITMPSAFNFKFTFMIQNVSNQVLNFNSMAGTVSINYNMVGNISYFPGVPIAIQPNSQQQVDIAFQLSLVGLAGEIIAAINTPASTLNFVASGNMNVNNLVLPFSVSQSLTV